MIFVTVGTHEQQFNRLVECVDKLKKNRGIDEEVIIQTGFSTYEPTYCTWHKFLPYQEMVSTVQAARIVVTHGGPSSFILPLQYGKVPIVVPRQKKYGEHVNDHQVGFCRAVAERFGNIIIAENDGEIIGAIRDYDVIINSMPKNMDSNNEQFNRGLEEMVSSMFIKSYSRG